ncbi:MAG TPA: DUF6491 family protein [Arenimonas sp.]|nr:DUF6491 family protein [Arenimonas sp.]
MKRNGLLLLSSLMLGACASAGAPRVNEKLAEVMVHAGEPVLSAQRLSSVRLSGYETLGDRHLMVSEGASKAWLLEVDGSCWNLESAHQIAVVQKTPWLDAMSSRVVVGDQSCMITKIWKVDAKALREARKAKRKAEAAD